MGRLRSSALAIALLAAGLVSCGGEPTRGRLLLIGVDGATMRVAGPLMEKGRMPAFSRIAREGVAGSVRSARPLLSPRIWNSIATGKVPKKHGISNFSRPRMGREPELLLSHHRKVHALWNIASDAGRSVVVINWWNTYPPERIDGVMVSDHLFAAEIRGRRNLTGAVEVPTGDLVHPASWQARISRIIDENVIPVPVANPFAEAALPAWMPEQGLTRHFNEDGALVAAALEIEAEVDPDILMILLTGVDRVSHHVWAGLEKPELYPKHLRLTPDQREAAAGVLRAYYEYTDALVGLLVERFGPDDLVVLLSDHGFEAKVGPWFLTGGHDSDESLDGILLARGPGVVPGADTGTPSIYDITPTLLNWLGIPAASDMDGAPAGFLDVPPIPPVPSHDVGEVERLSTAPSGADEEVLDQLRTLGYVE